METNPLIGFPPPIAGVVDHRGRPIATGSTTGQWISAFFIIGVEMAERFAYCGIEFNLITYLTGPLREPTAAAAGAVNAWSGVASMLPLVGALVADSWLGRYRTIVVGSVLYILGLGMLALSTLLPSTHCGSNTMATSSCPPPELQVIFFYVSLYLVAFAQGCHKPCTQAFGADQFDPNDPSESKSRSSFFNWWYFGMNLGILFTLLLSYVQDNISWAFGFGIPCIAMVLALFVFLAGTRTYRYCVVEGESPFVRIAGAFGMMICRWRWRDSTEEAFALQSLTTCSCDWSPSTKTDVNVNTAHQQIEEAKAILRLFPIWSSCLIYAVVLAQGSTFFTKQASTIDRRITSSFQVPPAALQNIVGLTIVIFVPIYDHILVPLSSTFSSGITMLQRIGTGILLSTLAMIISALVETKRLQTASEYGLIDSPEKMIPMSLWWLMPQYVLFGVADVFTMIGLQEFFYDQVPDELRSLGLALYLSIFGIGSFISGFLITVIDAATTKNGGSWFGSNLNRAHLDYFYWLLAGLSALWLFVFVFFARRYIYRKKGQLRLV